MMGDTESKPDFAEIDHQACRHGERVTQADSAVPSTATTPTLVTCDDCDISMARVTAGTAVD